MRALRRIVHAPATTRHIAEEVEPGPMCASDDDLLDYIRRRRFDGVPPGQHLPHEAG